MGEPNVRISKTRYPRQVIDTPYGEEFIQGVEEEEDIYSNPWNESTIGQGLMEQQTIAQEEDDDRNSNDPYQAELDRVHHEIHEVNSKLDWIISFLKNGGSRTLASPMRMGSPVMSTPTTRMATMSRRMANPGISPIAQQQGLITQSFGTTIPEIQSRIPSANIPGAASYPLGMGSFTPSSPSMTYNGTTASPRRGMNITGNGTGIFTQQTNPSISSILSGSNATSSSLLNGFNNLTGTATNQFLSQPNVQSFLQQPAVQSVRSAVSQSGLLNAASSQLPQGVAQPVNSALNSLFG